MIQKAKLTATILILLLCPVVAYTASAAQSFSVEDAVAQHNADGATVAYTARMQEALKLEQIGFQVEDTSTLYVIDSGFISPAHSGEGVLIITNTKDVRKLSRYMEDGRISKSEMIRIGFIYARTEKSDNAPSLFDIWRAM